MVLKGFNSEITHNGTSYHVQTEDWGSAKCSIATKVFKNGAVIKSIIQHYGEISRGNIVKPDILLTAMKKQHENTLTGIKSGDLK